MKEGRAGSGTEGKSGKGMGSWEGLWLTVMDLRDLEDVRKGFRAARKVEKDGPGLASVDKLLKALPLLERRGVAVDRSEPHSQRSEIEFCSLPLASVRERLGVAMEVAEVWEESEVRGNPARDVQSDHERSETSRRDLGIEEVLPVELLDSVLSMEGD